jgi:hypothetical protein
MVHVEQPPETVLSRSGQWTQEPPVHAERGEAEEKPAKPLAVVLGEDADLDLSAIPESSLHPLSI